MHRLILIVCCFVLATSAGLAQTAPIPMPRIDRGDGTGMQEGFAPTQDDPASSALEALSEALLTPNVPEGPPQPLTLSAKISDEGAVIPTGLVWRVFDGKTDANGELALLAKSTDPVADFELPPGDYVVHVAYGRSQATDTVRVETAPTAKTIVLDSGAIRLNAAISGDIAIEARQLRFAIYATALDGNDRILIDDAVAPGDVIHLNAGVYHVVSRYGDLNAIVRADLRVDPGQMTDATLYHHARLINFKLVSEPDGEAIADVDWVVRTADGETIYSSFGAFPSAILSEGDYTIIAKRGQRVYNRNFSVEAGAPTEVEVLTSVYEAATQGQ